MYFFHRCYYLIDKWSIFFFSPRTEEYLFSLMMVAKCLIDVIEDLAHFFLFKRTSRIYRVYGFFGGMCDREIVARAHDGVDPLIVKIYDTSTSLKDCIQKLFFVFEWIVPQSRKLLKDIVRIWRIEDLFVFFQARDEIFLETLWIREKYFTGRSRWDGVICYSPIEIR